MQGITFLIEAGLGTLKAKKPDISWSEAWGLGKESALPPIVKALCLSAKKEANDTITGTHETLEK